MNQPLEALKSNAIKIINNNPQLYQQIMNNPAKKSMYEALVAGDDERCEQLADNFCQSTGMSRERAMQTSYNFLQQGFGRR